MPKFCGMIGYASQLESAPGVHTPSIIERPYTGELLENVRRWESGENLNDDFNITNKISVLADEYAYSNLYNMVYVTFMGAKWKIKSVEISHPRLILSIGGVYNGGDDPCCNTQTI